MDIKLTINCCQYARMSDLRGTVRLHFLYINIRVLKVSIKRCLYGVIPMSVQRTNRVLQCHSTTLNPRARSNVA